MNTLDRIQEKTLNMEIKKELRIRELVRIIPHTSLGMAKSENAHGELPGNYDIFFENGYKTEGLQEAINEGKTVLVTLKEFNGHQNVIKSHIRKPNVEIKESSLEEQRAEIEQLGQDY